VSPIEVSINGAARTVRDVAELRAWLRTTRDTRSVEVWLRRPGGEALAIVTSGDRAWLMYLPHEGAAGYSSRDPAYDGPANAVLDFLLGNGQRDVYPASWTISTDAAMSAAEYFFSSGGRDPRVVWHDDSPQDNRFPTSTAAP
jgi:hypothetical protein